MAISSIEITNLEGLLVAIRKHDDVERFWYRGEQKADPSRTLRPGVFRRTEWTEKEDEILARFCVSSPVRHLKSPEYTAYGAWLAMAAHYGLPTRLLDWTSSPLVAAFFAVEGRNTPDGRIWVLDSEELNKVMTGEGATYVLQGHLPEAGNELRDWPDVARMVGAAFGVVSEPVRQRDRGKAIAIEPFQHDIRLLVQSAHFTIHGCPTPLTELDRADSYLREFRISAAAKKGIREDLARLHINRNSLFPDLDNAAKHIRETYPS